ncbi:DnaJ domain-containing protein [Lusitaniella coriacea LEGE 07157]|uniref:DnaJ domain-containing protein n=1 Tax=Lusitaniella coriacea LEGE 07157 TaxID=945747 RepID=A0A8J7ASC8_9CYAN|nr:J domain-containing protein [Lusitaniella coriacea]MBE9115451.1 DnaJ domain-containing protein [Lusitaniella coriacea LEGE 07157]
MSFKIKRGLFKFDLTDHHAVLGIPINADTKQARKQYLKIARSLHPDTVKSKSDVEKKQASELLSKLVNPAYEQLSKSASQNEYQLVLSQTGKRLAGERNKPALESDIAKQLARAGANIDTAYQTALKQLASSQYEDPAQALKTIAEISELNMVYLMCKQGSGVGVKSKAQPTGSSNASPKSPTGSKPPASAQAQPEKTSPVDPYVRRAQEYIKKNNYAKAVLELRDALKLEPNNSSCHAMLGMTYLRQNQVTMAKVHINKALASNPEEPLALQGKKALDRIMGQTTPSSNKSSAAASQSKSSQQQSKKGLFGGMFGGKKK